LQDIAQKEFEIYDAKWIKGQVCRLKGFGHKNEVIAALKAMSQIEFHNAPPKQLKFSGVGHNPVRLAKGL